MTNYYNYLGRYGKTQLWKFGETTNTNRRANDIKKEAMKKNIRSAENFHLVEVSNIAHSKAQSLLIEGVVRAEMESRGYTLEGNDHFRTNKKANDVYKDYYEALSKAVQIVTMVYNK